MTDTINYAKLNWQYHNHAVRYAARVNAMPRKLICQDCHGAGGWREVIDYELGGPWFMCSWCCGTGFLTPYDRGKWLRYKVSMKKDK